MTISVVPFGCVTEEDRSENNKRMVLIHSTPGTVESQHIHAGRSEAEI